ncbi:MAG TPA: hypothetical protein VFA89_24155 [Terriglobales bacterium]|nr:hypothetical protein [Terriglobales bacterium]
MRGEVTIFDLPDHGDLRGHSFTLPEQVLEFVGGVLDVHVASMLAGAVRGNHYHLRRREAIVLAHEGDCSVHWQNDENSEIRHRPLQGGGCQVVLVPPGASHAVRNDSDHTLWLVAYSSQPYDPVETIARKII